VPLQDIGPVKHRLFGIDAAIGPDLGNQAVIVGPLTDAGVLHHKIDFGNGGKNGVETITISKMGNFIYMFMAHKYESVTEFEAFGLAAGEDPIFFPPMENEEETKTEENKEKEGIPDSTLPKSGSILSLYVHGYKSAINTIQIPSTANLLNRIGTEQKKEDDYKWWLGFCFDGSKGIQSMKIINKVSSEKPNYSYCSDLYKQ
jgi:hypothetical protein